MMLKWSSKSLLMLMFTLTHSRQESKQAISEYFQGLKRGLPDGRSPYFPFLCRHRFLTLAFSLSASSFFLTTGCISRFVPREHCCHRERRALILLLFPHYSLAPKPSKKHAHDKDAIELIYMQRCLSVSRAWKKESICSFHSLKR